jgi:hypothetical protein
MKPLLMPVMVAALALSAALAPRAATAQQARCLRSDYAIAEARTERPSTIVMAVHDGSEAVAIRAVMSDFVANNQVPAADAIAVLHSESSSNVLLIGSQDGCLRWRGVFPMATYEEVLRKALGVPV